MTGAQVTDLRNALGMTIRDMSRALNVTPLALSRWERTGPNGLGSAVLAGLYQAVFDSADLSVRATRAAKISNELQLGLGAMLCFRLLDVVKSGVAA